MEVADKATQTFLTSFRKCPENPEFVLHEWRRSLWENSLGKNNRDISGDIYYRWLDLRYKYLEPSAEVVALLESLRERYRLAIITNGPSHSQWEKVEKLQLAQYFELILVSGDVEWEKPDENIFLEACLCLGVSAEECIMVGDKLETDILGGIRACLGATVWMPASESDCEPIEIVPDCVVHDIGQLGRILSGQDLSRPSSEVSDRNKAGARLSTSRQGVPLERKPVDDH